MNVCSAILHLTRTCAASCSSLRLGLSLWRNSLECTCKFELAERPACIARHLPRLRELGMEGSHLSTAAITPLTALSALDVLCLGHNDLQDLQPLSPQTQLQRLHFGRHPRATNLSALSCRVRLTKLDMQTLSLADMSGGMAAALRRLTSLVSLHMAVSGHRMLRLPANQHTRLRRLSLQLTGRGRHDLAVLARKLPALQELILGVVHGWRGLIDETCEVLYLHPRLRQYEVCRNGPNALQDHLDGRKQVRAAVGGGQRVEWV